MKYELTNIPVYAAYEAGPDCTLCHLEDALEKQYVSFFLGNSVMVPEMRVEVNRKGFCGRHLGMLLRGTNKLGLALMLQTHMEDRENRLEAGALKKTFREGKEGGKSPGMAGIFSGARGALNEEVRSLAGTLESGLAGCMLCDRLEHTLANYRFTIVKLFETQEDFRRILGESRGFCLRHTPGMLRMASELLKGDTLRRFVAGVLQRRHLSTASLLRDLEGFVGKFDYRNNEEMEERERTAVSRAVRLLGADDV